MTLLRSCCGHQILIAWMFVFFKSGQSECYDVSYTGEAFGEILHVDCNRTLSTASSCYTLCSMNRTCAAVAYESETSSCLMSSKPHFISNSSEGSLMRSASRNQLKLYTPQKDLTNKNTYVSMSSMYGFGEGKYSVDDIFLETDDYIAHTEADQSPWIQVHLESDHWISGVCIWVRPSNAHGVKYSLTNTTITVGEFEIGDYNMAYPEDQICTTLDGKAPPVEFCLACRKPMLGKYVRITAYEMYYFMMIYELEISGYVEMSVQTEV